MESKLFRHLIWCIGLFLFCSQIGQAQDFNLPDFLPETATSCGGTIYDNGGPGGDAQAGFGSLTITSEDGSTPFEINVILLELDPVFELLTIYDGPDVNAPILFEGSDIPSTLMTTGGSFTVSLTATGLFEPANLEMDFTCVASDQPPVASFTASPPSFSCDGGFTFSDNSGNLPDSWEWDFGDGNTSTNESPNHSYTDSGVYTVTLVTCNDNGCDETTVDFEVLEAGDPLCSGTNQEINSTQTITDCEGLLYDSGGETGEYSDGETSTTIIQNNAGVPIELSFTEFNLEQGYDEVQVFDGNELLGLFTGADLPNGGEPIIATSGEMTITLISDPSVTGPGFAAFFSSGGGDEIPEAAFTVEETSVPFAAPIQFTDISSGEPGAWFWDFGDGNTSNEQNPVHSFSQSGDFTVTLTVSNCLGEDLSEEVMIMVQGPPFMIYSPEEITVTLNGGETTTETVTIQNFGGGDLYYELTGYEGTFAGYINVLVYDFLGNSPSDADAISNIQEIIDEKVNGTFISTTTTTSASELEDLLETTNVFIIGGQEGNNVNAGLMSTFAPILDAFVADGGSVIFTGTSTAATIFNTGLFSGSFGGTLMGPTLTHEGNHPIVSGVEQLFEGQIATIGQNINNADAITLIESNGNDIVTYREGDGRVVYIGFNYVFSNESMDQILANAVQWSGLPDANLWLTVDPITGQVIPGDASEVTLNFSAVGAPAGTYTVDLIINTNDIDNAAEVVSVTLIVVGIPGFAINTTDIDYGNVVQFATETEEVIISNPGSDSLFITNIILPSDAFSVESNSFSVGPGGSESLEISFNPQEIGTLEDLVVILETNTGTYEILIDAEVTGAPSVGATPSPIEISVSTGDTGSVPVTISNAGEGVLEYCLEAFGVLGNESIGFEVIFTIDNFPGEFFWQLVDSQGTIVEEVQAGTYNSSTTETVILDGLDPEESYTLLFLDTFGDGALTNYTITDLTTGQMIASGSFSNGDEQIVNLGSPSNGIVEVPWLSTDIDCETVLASEDGSFMVLVDPGNFLGGVYEGVIIVNSNDPVNPNYEIPVILTVIGVPDIEVQGIPTDNTLDFGTVLVGLNSDQTITITNPGTDQLIIDEFIFDDPQFSINNENVELAPGESITLTITYTPDGINDTEGTLIIANNVEDITVNLIGVGQGAAAGSVSPESLEFTLLSGEQDSQDISLFNSGEGDLIYDISFGSAGEESGFEFCFNISPQGFAIFLGFQVVDENGTVVFDVPNGTYGYNTGEICETIFVNPSSNYTLNVSDDDDGYFGQAIDGWSVTDLVTGDEIISANSGSLSSEPLGAPNPAGGFMIVSPIDGEIPFPAGEGTLTVTVDVDGVLAGTYEEIILITSNDPVNPVISIPVTINVIAFPQAVFSSDNDPVVCGTAAVQFTDESVNVPTEWLWDFGDGTTSTEQNPIHQYNTSGNYDVTLIATNDVGADTLILEDWIIVDSDCVTASIPNNGTNVIEACNGELFDSGGPNDDYLINQSGAVTISVLGASSITVDFVTFNYENGFDFVNIYDGPDTDSPLIGTYTGTELFGQSVSSSGSAITIEEVNDPFGSMDGFAAFFSCDLVESAPTADFESTPNSTCGGLVSFDDNSLGVPNTWAWDFGDGMTSSEQNPIHQYAESGTYTVSLEVSNALGSDDTTAVFDVTVLVVESTIPELGTAGEEVAFSIDNIDPSWNISWDFGDGFTANLPNATHTYDITGDSETFTVTLIVADLTVSNDCFVTIEEEITITAEPNVALTLQVETNLDDIVVDNGMYVIGTFNDWGALGEIEMTEVDTDLYEVTIPVSQNSEHLYRFVNGSNEEIIVGDCATEDGTGGLARSISVAEEALEVPVVCFALCQTCILIGVEELANANLVIAPNPSAGQLNFNLSLDQMSDLQLNITNTLGQTIYSDYLKGASNYQENIDLTDYPNGVYFIQFVHENKQLVQSFVLQK